MLRRRIHIQFTCLLVLLLFPCAFSQTKPNDTSRDAISLYDSILSKLRSGDTKIDFTSLRIAYSETKDASPFGADHESRRVMNVAAMDGQCADAIKLADDILAKFYLSPDAHAAKSKCYSELKDPAKAAFHKSIYLGLINSVLAKGDGNTFDTAYRVITIEEEYAVMKALGYTVWAQDYERRGDHLCDVLRATDNKTKQAVKLYFNVDIPARLEQKKTTVASDPTLRVPKNRDVVRIS